MTSQSQPKAFGGKPLYILAALLSGAILLAIVLWRDPGGTATDFVPPEAARLAIIVAKTFAATNGCDSPTVRYAKPHDGRWVVTLSSKSGHTAVVQVSDKGEVLWYSGIR